MENIAKAATRIVLRLYYMEGCADCIKQEDIVQKVEKAIQPIVLRRNTSNDKTIAFSVERVDATDFANTDKCKKDLVFEVPTITLEAYGEHVHPLGRWEECVSYEALYEEVKWAIQNM